MSPGGEQRPDRRASDALRDSGFFAFRVPALPIDVLTQWAEGMEAPACAPEDLEGALERDRVRLSERLREVARRPEVTAALSVASPDLVDALRAQDGDPRVESALVRYVSRMASRPTPFGLFAACGVGEIAERTQLSLPDPACWHRHTRLDGDYLDRVIRDRVAELRERLTFRPNDSLYRIGDRWRYVQARLDGLVRTHHLAEISDSDHLTRALAACEAGAGPADIAAAVAAGGVEPGPASRYVDELIAAQVLVANLALTITGRPPLDALIADLEAAGDDGTVTVLSAVRDELAAVDAHGTKGGPERPDGIAALLSELPVPAGRARLLQVDATVPQCGATLARSVVDDVLRGVELLSRISPAGEPTELERFRQAFTERYEEREVALEVPLLEALDDDLGPGFGAGGDPSPLLRGLVLPRRELQATVGRREGRLLELMHRAWALGALEVSLRPDDIAELERDDALPLPGAVGAVASLARTRDGLRVVVSFASGPPGVGVLGRFCQADPVLDARVRAHLRAEEALEPDAIHAEIAHLPSGFLSNVLVRPVLREWELEWLGRSGAPPERRLPVSDLLVSHRGGRFVLRSRSLGREVLPRLTSAHNWSRRSPAVYRFLAAIQSQGTAGSVSWSWAPLDRAPFTPRVRWGRLILAPAAWRAPRSELRELDGPDPVARWRAVQVWRERRRLPRWVCLVDGDNKLAIDLDNTLSVDTFVRITRRRESALIEELYPRPDELIAEARDGHRALELVIPLVRSAAAPAGDPVAGLTRSHRFASNAGQTAAPSRLRRTFPPGSEWTYLKLYTGPASADSLLREMIAPLAHELISSGAADRWFFLRFGDPRFHLRVRFHGDDPAVLGSVQQLAARALEAGLAQNAELGTYQREIERYGGADGMLVAERLFHADSDAVVALLDMFEPGERGGEERWQIGVLGSDALMCDLGLDDEARAAFTRRMHAALERHFRADARLRNAIAGRVRAELGTVDALLAATASSDHPLAPGTAVLAQRSERIRPLAAELTDLRAAGSLDLPPDALAASYLHMWLNRMCRSQNSFQEYVTYALLARVLRARVAREDAVR
jgi:lantibiotic biosynthesis protein